MRQASCIVYCIAIYLCILMFGIGSIATSLVIAIQFIIGLIIYSITIRFTCKIGIHNSGWEDLISYFGLAKSTSVHFIQLCNHSGFMDLCILFYVLWLTCWALLSP
jgi:hypothetical protein